MSEELEKLKKSYEPFQKKYSLPTFEELNEEFIIERIAESETEFLIREIRRHILEKFSNTLRVLDILINPSNTPLFLIPAIKAITKEDKCVLEKIYGILSKNEFSCVKMDLTYSFEEEIKYIKESYSSWKSMKDDLHKIFQDIENNWDKKTEKSNSCYFG